MTKEIIHKNTTELSETEFGTLTPLASRALFWRAHYMVSSPVLNQLPFIFWLIENTRPNVTVTLGLDDAVAHFAICQATEKLGMEAMCFGIQASEAETAGEDAPNLQAVLDYNDRLYSDFSQIIQTDHASAAEYFQDTEIDFLTVTQPATQALLDEIDRHWLPRMSERGVILFTHGGAKANYMAYIHNISHNRGVFTLDPVNGTCVVLHGEKQNDRLQRLAKLKIGKPGYLSVRNIFTRLGELHSKADLLERKTREAAENRRLLEQKADEITAYEKKFSDIQGKTAKLADQMKHAATEATENQVAVFELRETATAQTKTATEQAIALTNATEETATWKLKVDETGASLAAVTLELNTARQKTDIQTTEIEGLKARLKTAEHEIDRLHKTFAEHDETLTERYSDIATLGLEMDKTTKERDILAQERDTARKDLDIRTAELEEHKERITALETSTSWRVTAPLRSIRRLSGGHK
ncbi:MAG: hypothetical protein L3J36_13235 [Rhodobacteraceae bacterium]|nr:hypothetical protein [Paracoccaceae bacterium]